MEAAPFAGVFVGVGVIASLTSLAIRGARQRAAQRKPTEPAEESTSSVLGRDLFPEALAVLAGGALGWLALTLWMRWVGL